MLIEQFCMTFITMTEKKKERERKVLGIRQQAEEGETFFNK